MDLKPIGPIQYILTRANFVQWKSVKLTSLSEYWREISGCTLVDMGVPSLLQGGYVVKTKNEKSNFFIKKK